MRCTTAEEGVRDVHEYPACVCANVRVYSACARQHNHGVETCPRGVQLRACGRADCDCGGPFIQVRVKSFDTTP